MPQNHVVTTSAYSAAISKLSFQSQSNLALEVAARVKADFDQFSADTVNRANQIAAVAADALAKADTLGDAEKGQVEAALQQFLSTSGLQTVLDGMGLSIGGKSYTLQSVLLGLVNADKIALEEFTYSATTGALTNARYTLQDGYVALMEFTQSNVLGVDGVPTGDIRFDGACTNWRGIAVNESFVLRPVKQTVSVMGVSYDSISDIQLVSKGNITFDITANLVLSTPVTSAVPDLNANGVIGS